MHPARRAATVLTLSLPAFVASAASAADLRLELREGWAIQSSAKVTAGGEAVARTGFATLGWHRATVPTTVVAALVADGTYPDPYYGTNLRAFPGMSYKVGTNFSNQPMPADSPFAVPWWYRTEFTLAPQAKGRTLWLRMDGVNFRFDAWLNGKKIADAAKTAGAYRVHEIDVTAAARPGANALAVLVSAPTPHDLAITFVDWNPMPPDKVMGLYRPVTLTSSGPVALRHPQVVTTLASGQRSGRADGEGVRDERQRRSGHGDALGPSRGRRVPEGRRARGRRDARDRPGAVRVPAARAREAEALVARAVRRAGAATTSSWSS